MSIIIYKHWLRKDDRKSIESVKRVETKEIAINTQSDK